MFCVAALAVFGFKRTDRGRVGYRRGRFLSENEKAFLETLDRVVGPDHRVFAQVRLAEVVDVDGGGSPPARWKVLSQVVGKSVDFVICDRWSLDPLMALEVDDRSHRAPERRQRDALVDRFCAEVGLPPLRVTARLADSEDALLRTLQASGFWLAPKFSVK